MQRIYPIDMEHEPWKLKFSSDGQRLLIMNRYTVASYTVEGTLQGHPIQPIIAFDADYMNDDQIVLTGFSQDRQHGLFIYDIHSQQVRAFTATEELGEIRSVSVDQERGRIYAGVLDDSPGAIRVYDLNLNLKSEFRVPELYMPLDIVVSHSGDKLAVAGEVLGVWDVTGTPTLISEECPAEEDCTGTPCEVSGGGDITPDGRFAATGLHGSRGICAVVDTSSGNVIGWYGPPGYHSVNSVSLHPSGKYVAVASTESNPIKIYNVADGSIFDRYHPKEQSIARFSPQGDVLAVAGQTSITLWPFEG